MNKAHTFLLSLAALLSVTLASISTATAQTSAPTVVKPANGETLLAWAAQNNLTLPAGDKTAVIYHAGFWAQGVNGGICANDAALIQSLQRAAAQRSPAAPVIISFKTAPNVMQVKSQLERAGIDTSTLQLATGSKVAPFASEQPKMQGIYIARADGSLAAWYDAFDGFTHCMVKNGLPTLQAGLIDAMNKQ